ncbi:MAG: sensor histidine kinase, partial [Thermodesulfobacteriota bacterium]
ESQAQLIQSEKMGALGTMVAGVAHELNNPMMGILNFIQYCRKHTPEDDRKYSVLQDAEHETGRCMDIVQNLLTFSRMEKEGEEGRQKESCAAIFDRIFKLLSYRVGLERVTVNRHTAEGTPAIWIKVNSIQQVFFNLISNALDALKDSEKKEIHVTICRKGEFVQVTIADTGCGIAPEDIQRIYAPFYTTKPTGKGTGLGLSVCHGIIQAHGGEITCESRPGEGTTFTILLPIEKRKEGETGNR